MTCILCLDDDREMRALLALVLEAKGYEVLLAEHDYEAWALLHALPVDLVIQDLARSAMSGIDFYRCLRADPALAGLAVMLVSAGAEAAEIQALDLAGRLIKPFEVGRLLDLVYEALARRDIPRPAAAGPGQPWSGRAPLLPPEALLAAPATRIGLWVLWRSKPAFSIHQTVETLLTILAEGQPTAAMEAARALGEVQDSRVAPALWSALTSGAWQVRWAAAQSLGRHRAYRALSEIVAALADEQPLVRLSAVRALREFKDAAVTEPLVAALNDPDMWVRHAAITAWRDHRPEPALLQAALEGAIASATPDVIGQLVRAEADRLLSQ